MSGSTTNPFIFGSITNLNDQLAYSNYTLHNNAVDVAATNQQTMAVANNTSAQITQQNAAALASEQAALKHNTVQVTPSSGGAVTASTQSNSLPPLPAPDDGNVPPGTPLTSDGLPMTFILTGQGQGDIIAAAQGSEYGIPVSFDSNGEVTGVQNAAYMSALPSTQQGVFQLETSPPPNQQGVQIPLTSLAGAFGTLAGAAAATLAAGLTENPEIVRWAAAGTGSAVTTGIMTYLQTEYPGQSITVPYGALQNSFPGSEQDMFSVGGSPN